MLRIPSSNLPRLELGDINQTALGTDVFVLGYPLDSTSLNVTRGIISAYKPDLGVNALMLQTDAAINPGSSGGPMLNLQGQVIGIVKSERVNFGAQVDVRGVGFAISVNTVKPYLERLKDGQLIAK